MRKALLTLGLLLSASLAQAQPIRQAPYWLRLYLPIRPQLVPGAGGGGTFAGGALTNPTTVLDGTNFSILNTADPLKVVQFSAASVTSGQTVTPLVFGGTAASMTVKIAGGVYMTSADVRLGSGGFLGFSSNADPSLASMDAYFQRDGGASKIQMGTDINGAAVNQSLSAGDGITGTDILGSGFDLSAGLGTGAAASNPLSLSRQITKATGTTAQTSAPALIVCPSKILSNTSATTTTIATITTTTTSGGNVTMDYGTRACDASTCDADGGIVKVAWNNNAGTVAAAMTAIVLQADSDATGNITTAPTATVATNVVSIKATPAFTTIVPTSVIFTASFTVHSALDTVVCQ